MTLTWLSVAAFARLRRVTRRWAREVLAGWETTPGAPRVERMRGRRGPLALHVCAEDVATLYAVDLSDVRQLAA